MNNTYKSLVGLSLALAPFAMAQDAAPADAPANTPTVMPELSEEKPAATPAPSAETVKTVASYALGFPIGATFAQSYPKIAAADFKGDVFQKAFTDYLSQTIDPTMGNVNMQEYMGLFETMMSDRAAGKETTFPADGPSKDAVINFVSYYIGFSLAQYVTGDYFPSLELADIELPTVFRGFTEGFTSKIDPAIEAHDVSACMMAFETILRERLSKAGEINLKAGEAYMAENAKKDGVVTLPSGLQYKVLTEGTGAKYDEAKLGASAIAKVMYEGRKIDGTIFDASTEPIEFPIDGVVPGFSEALKLMPIGSEWEITMPSNLAYGANGPAAIGSNATLIFKMTLVDMKAAQGTKSNPIELTPEMEAQLREQGLIPVQE